MSARILGNNRNVYKGYLGFGRIIVIYIFNETKATPQGSTISDITLFQVVQMIK